MQVRVCKYVGDESLECFRTNSTALSDSMLYAIHRDNTFVFVGERLHKEIKADGMVGIPLLEGEADLEDMSVDEMLNKDLLTVITEDKELIEFLVQGVQLHRGTPLKYLIISRDP